jgi:hypothetical protein
MTHIKVELKEGEEECKKKAWRLCRNFLSFQPDDDSQ